MLLSFDQYKNHKSRPIFTHWTFKRNIFLSRNAGCFFALWQHGLKHHSEFSKRSFVKTDEHLRQSISVCGVSEFTLWLEMKERTRAWDPVSQRAFGPDNAAKHVFLFSLFTTGTSLKKCLSASSLKQPRPRSALFEKGKNQIFLQPPTSGWFWRSRRDYFYRLRAVVFFLQFCITHSHAVRLDVPEVPAVGFKHSRDKNTVFMWCRSVRGLADFTTTTTWKKSSFKSKLGVYVRRTAFISNTVVMLQQPATSLRTGKKGLCVRLCVCVCRGWGGGGGSGVGGCKRRRERMRRTHGSAHTEALIVRVKKKKTCDKKTWDGGFPETAAAAFAAFIDTQ